MKKFSVMMMALALVMGMTQCKKEQPENNNTNDEFEGEKYEITLNLGGGDGNAKADVYPFEGTDNYAPVYYQLGDKIEVVYKGERVGTLTCTASNVPVDHSQYNDATATFGGGISIREGVSIDGSTPLYFYFIGNKAYGNESGKLIVDISDQTGSLPVISYAKSAEGFVASLTEYTIDNGYNGSNWLLNQCALVRFKSENIYHNENNTIDNNDNAIYTTDKVITVYGFDNQVTIDLTKPGADGHIKWGKVDGEVGAIKLYMRPAPSSETEAQAAERIQMRYAIVKPDTYAKTDAKLEVAFTPKRVQVDGVWYSADPYGFFGTYKLNATVENNDYYPDGELDLVWHSGAVSISSGQQVVFTRGNIQYNLNTGKWRLAKHQYDWVGGMVASQSGSQYNNNTRQGNVSLDDRNAHGTNDETAWSKNEYITTTSYGWIDLFGYATANNPTLHTTTNQDYPNTWVEFGNKDFPNSGKPGTGQGWYTLSKDEWIYIFGWGLESVHPRRTKADEKFGLATITTGAGAPTAVKGLVILPDESSVSGFVSAKSASQGLGNHPDWGNNTYDVTSWKAMEAQGAIFLPCSGRRNGTDFDNGAYANQDYGVYWSRDPMGEIPVGTGSWSGGDGSWSMVFGYNIADDRVNPYYPTAPDNGHAIRLVHNVP